MRKLPKAQIDTKVREAARVLDITHLLDRRPRELSGGQQQRVGIARSLAVEPEIWFLDEPFSALDPLIRREMQTELIRLQSVLKKTIVFITHDFDEAIRLADRVAIMKDGEIIQVGTPEELVLHPATSYVAEFTRAVQRSKVMSAARLMRPLSASPDYGGQISASDKISTFAARIVGAKKPFLVLDTNGAPLGEVTPDAVIDLLAERDQLRETRA
jgi:glycine betaine/proline transport system ATP-binding protein